MSISLVYPYFIIIRPLLARQNPSIENEYHTIYLLYKMQYKHMEDKENMDNCRLQNLENISRIYIQKYCNQPSIKYTPYFTKRLLTSREEEKIRERPEIRLAFSDLLLEQMDFIRSTVGRISEILNCTIHIDSNNLMWATHVITNTTSDGLCKRTYNYLASIVMKKSIVSFLWYADLFDRSKKMTGDKHSTLSFMQYLSQVTQSNIVKGDCLGGPSKAPMLAHMSTNSTPLLEGLNVKDKKHLLSPMENSLIIMAGGVVNAKNTSTQKKPSRYIKITEEREIFKMVSSGLLLTFQTLDSETSSSADVSSSSTTDSTIS
ncbi:hypothetical protein NEIRO03_2468 [Nematocida sp. AWRm78]|nr:hypothetical protein NEIRO03_2468 [Nematocida sp. AWRm78]